MDKAKFDQEETSILESYDQEEWKSVDNFEVESHRYREAARATLRKDSRVDIRISSKDLEALQKKALEEGIPYQTLIASVLHKFVSGRLVDRQ